MSLTEVKKMFSDQDASKRKRVEFLVENLQTQLDTLCRACGLILDELEKIEKRVNIIEGGASSSLGLINAAIDKISHDIKEIQKKLVEDEKAISGIVEKSLNDRHIPSVVINNTTSTVGGGVSGDLNSIVKTEDTYGK